MNVNHRTLPYETVETCVKVSRNCEESVKVYEFYRMIL